MTFFILIDGSFIVLLFFLFFALIGGTAYEFAHFISDNLGTIISICVIVSILEILFIWWLSKQILPSLSTIVYSTQFCFFVVYGMYQLGMMSEDHPIECVILFFCYAIYILFNSCGFLLLADIIDLEKAPKQNILIDSHGRTYCIIYIIVGLIGWLINWWILF